MAVDVEVLPNRAGAIVHGADVGPMMSDSTFQDIYEAYLNWANVVVTGQDHIEPEDCIAFCGRFGEIIAGIPSTSRQQKYSEQDINEAQAPKYTLPDHPEIFVISNEERQGKAGRPVKSRALLAQRPLLYECTGQSHLPTREGAAKTRRRNPVSQHL